MSPSTVPSSDEPQETGFILSPSASPTFAILLDEYEARIQALERKAKRAGIMLQSQMDTIERSRSFEERLKKVNPGKE